MHISDGVLPAPVWVGGYLVTAGITAVTMKKMRTEEMPRMAVMTSAFFVASLVHIPLGPTSVHLILNGLAGILLGPLSFISILIGLAFQALLFQHGGITTIGVNAVMMGIPAIVCYKIFCFHQKVHFRWKETLFGAIAGGVGVFLGIIILAVLLVTAGDEFIGVAKYAVVAHLPVMGVEAIISGFVVSFLAKVKPEMLEA